MREKLMLFNFLVQIGHRGVVIKVVQHFTPLGNDLSRVTPRYESGDLALSFAPHERSPKAPFEGCT